MIDLRQLRYFKVLGETLHFGQAAELLHISQPPLSRQIAALERTLGVPLLARNSRTARLTPAGRRFHEQTRTLLDALDRAVRDAQATARGERGQLRLGFTMLAAWNVLPRLLKDYADAHPDVDVALTEVVPRDLAAALAAGDADLGITFPGRLPPTLSYLPLHSEPLCAVLPAGHRLAQAAAVPVGELAGEPFVTFPASTAPALHEVVSACCRTHGFAPKARLETDLQQTIVNLVAAGLGVSLVPDSMRRMQLPGAVFRPLVASPRLELGVAWRIGNDNPCLPGFLAHARALAATGGADAPPASTEPAAPAP